MKSIRQYGAVMDRMQQDAACKQEVLAKANRSRIAVSRRSLITGTAVAAALLMLNIGIGGYFLHKTAEDSMTAVSETAEVTEIVPATTAAEIIAEQTVTVTAAKGQKLSGQKQNTAESAVNPVTQTVTEAAAAQTQPAAEQSAPAVTEKPVVQNAAKPVPVVPVRDGLLTYSLIPADKPYEIADGNEDTPVIFHVKQGEQVRMQLKVWNDPGAASFHVSYNMSECDLLRGTDSQYYAGNVSAGGTHATAYSMDRSLCFEGTGNGSSKAPDGAAIAECTLIAPSMPGSYLIQAYFPGNEYITDFHSDGTASKIHIADVFADADESQVIRHIVSGAEIIVDADETAPFGKEGALADPGTAGEPIIYIEPVTAHAGQKHVPVNVCIKGSDPFVSGWILLCCDPALKPLVYNSQTMREAGLTEDDRIGIRVEGTLLEHAPLIKSFEMIGIGVQLIFNNYRGFEKGPNGEQYPVCSGETQADAAIKEDGVLCTVYFDMPEECGSYRIFMDYATLGGGAQEEPDCLPDQQIKNYIPGNITVIP